MIREKIIDRSSSVNADRFFFRVEDSSIRMRDAAAIRLSAEMDKLDQVQEQLEFFENGIARDRALFVYLRDQFYDAGLDAGRRAQAGEKLLRTMDRLQRTLENSCGRLRGPVEP